MGFTEAVGDADRRQRGAGGAPFTARPPAASEPRAKAGGGVPLSVNDSFVAPDVTVSFPPETDAFAPKVLSASAKVEPLTGAASSFTVAVLRLNVISPGPAEPPLEISSTRALIVVPPVPIELRT